MRCENVKLFFLEPLHKNGNQDGVFIQFHQQCVGWKTNILLMTSEGQIVLFEFPQTDQKKGNYD